MATTFNLEIKKVPTSQGKYPVYIRVTKDRKMKRIKTSVALDRLSDWNPKAKANNWVRTSSRNAEKWNDALSKELEEAQDLYRDNKQASVDSIVSKLKNKNASESFVHFAKAYADTLTEVGKTNAKHYASFCRKLEAFLSTKGRTDISFSELTPAFVANFESFLLRENNENSKTIARRLNPNYVRAILVKFRALLNKAIKEGLMPADKYPFRNHPIPKELESGKQALDQSEIDALLALEYPEGSRLWHIKNAFLFSFYCAGIRAGDLVQLRWSNIKDEGTRLDYIMGKNHKQRNYPLMPQAIEILNHFRTAEARPTDYIFPFLDNASIYARYENVDTMPVEVKKVLFRQISSKNALINKYLRKVAEDAGIEKHISFHVSRHSFASIARERSVPAKMVQEALAHSSLTTTERYLHNFSSQEMDSTLQKVFASPEDTHKAEEEVLLKALKAMSASDIERLLAKLK